MSERGADLQDGPFRSQCEACEAKLCRLLQSGAAPQRRQLLRGERIGDWNCLKLWTVLDGLTAMCTTLPDGRRQIVCLSAPGELICPSTGNDDSDVWIEALTPSAICELDLGSQAEVWIGQDPLHGAELFRVAHDQVRRASAHLVTLGRLDAMERICLFLADMAWRIGRKTPRGWLVRLPLSRGDMADYLGLNPETVSRVLGRVKSTRLVTFLSPTEILVPNLQALQEKSPLTPLSATTSRRQRKAGHRELVPN